MFWGFYFKFSNPEENEQIQPPVLEIMDSDKSKCRSILLFAEGEIRFQKEYS